MPPDERKRRLASGEPYALRLDMQAALAGAGALTWQETGAGPSLSVLVAPCRSWLTCRKSPDSVSRLNTFEICGSMHS